ncbi:ATPase [Mycobacterium sp. 1274761.0]|nr:ATPase [Mycobacterium sp. 1274761.0]
MSGGPTVTTDAVRQLEADLARFGYLADEGLATAIHLAVRLRRPLLLEGEAGAGKTEVAKTLARLFDAKLLRLQCYEGIDVSQSVYEWDYARQLLHLKVAEARGAEAIAAAEDELFSERFLVRRPLLQALDKSDGPAPVLLIDEIDRADDEFEAFLLEILSDFAVTVPELKTITAEVPPLVILTSNRTRDLHDALKRRCLYHWVDHPDIDREVAIVRLRVPEASERLARRVAEAVEALRKLDLYKPPGVAETIDWARALVELGEPELAPSDIEHTLGWVLKYREDIEKARASGLDTLVRIADDDV